MRLTTVINLSTKFKLFSKSLDEIMISIKSTKESFAVAYDVMLYTLCNYAIRPRLI